MKITDKIHVLKIDFNIRIAPDKVMPRFVNVILVFGDKITLIDTGVKGSEKSIFRYIEAQGRHPNEIETIVLSHAHPDHIGSAAKIKELTQCTVAAHPLEKDWIENIEVQNELRPVPGFFTLVDQPVHVDRFINHDQRLKIAENTTLKFIHSPGHSKGSLNILFEEDNICFTADAIPLKNDILNYDNYLDLMESLEKIKHNKPYQFLLTSWTPVLRNEQSIDRLIAEGEAYMLQVDAVVKECYGENKDGALDNCRLTIEKLGLPTFLISPVVDKAFRSHFR